MLDGDGQGGKLERGTPGALYLRPVAQAVVSVTEKSTQQGIKSTYVTPAGQEEDPVGLVVLAAYG